LPIIDKNYKAGAGVTPLDVVGFVSYARSPEHQYTQNLNRLAEALKLLAGDEQTIPKVRQALEQCGRSRNSGWPGADGFRADVKSARKPTYEGLRRSKFPWIVLVQSAA
jgi:hypothetical protein